MEQYGSVWHTGTSLATWKAYLHCFSEKKSYRYALQGILWDLSKWSLMFALISGQDSTSLRGRKEGEYHKGKATIPGLIFFHFEPAPDLKFLTKLLCCHYLMLGLYKSKRLSLYWYNSNSYQTSLDEKVQVLQYSGSTLLLSVWLRQTEIKIMADH